MNRSDSENNYLKFDRTTDCYKWAVIYVQTRAWNYRRHLHIQTATEKKLTQTERFCRFPGLKKASE